MPVRFHLTPGTEADCNEASKLIEGIEAQALLADKAYDTNVIVEHCEKHDIEGVIPPERHRKNPRQFDKELYKSRHLVENAFMKIKRWRGIATRYAKRAASFEAAVQIRCFALWCELMC